MNPEYAKTMETTANKLFSMVFLYTDQKSTDGRAPALNPLMALSQLEMPMVDRYLFIYSRERSVSRYL